MGKASSVRLITLLLIMLATGSATFSQIAVTTNSNTQNLAQLLAGPGVTISNYTKTCDNNGTGTFANTNTNLGLSQGVILASGRVSNIPQAANNFASTQFTSNSDPQLATLTSGNIYDKCVLEFDIVPQGNSLQFQYVFASEEYPEFVCSQYNDVFGFFISGPDPNGGSYTNNNIALIPNSTLPVCINSVNGGVSGTYNGTTWNSSNCQSLTNTPFYTNNLNPLNVNLVYDGMTKVLTASASVVPCQTYHLKLAIADVGDRIYDSGVFLQAYSFTSTSVTLSASAQLDYAGYNSAYEGCVGGTFMVNLSAPQSNPVTVNLQITGTATNGVDYTTIPSTVIIPAGQTSVAIDLNPLQDGITEPTESVTISVLNPCTGLPNSSATLNIQDNTPLTITVSDSTLCNGQTAQLTATGGTSYSWSPSASLSNASISNPVATPTATTTYTVTATWGSCTKTGAVNVYTSSPSVAAFASPSAIICSGGNVQLGATVTGAAAPYHYNWSTGDTTLTINVSNSETYTFSVTDNYGCTASSSKTVGVSNPSISAITTNISCFGGNNGTINTTASGVTNPVTYHWNNNASSQNISSLATGVYTVTITDANGCSTTTSATVTQPSAALAVTATTNNVSCFGGNNGTINTTVTGGTTAYTYNWNGGVTTANRTGLTAGTYNLTVTDANGCSATISATITQPAAALAVTATTNNVSCFAGNNGTINTTVTGGTTSYAYNWTGGVTTANRTGLTAGTYNLTVTDANGCSTTTSATINQPSATLAVVASTNNVSCYGGNNGTINTTVTGGTTAYIYNWNGGVTTANRTGLTAGTYNLTVTDANGCSATTSATITQPAAALAVAASTNNVSCFGGNNGTINTTVTGGTTAYIYNWNGGVTTSNRTGLTAGTYNLTVTDANGCSATTSATITQPAAALAVAASTNNVSCFGGNNGTINTTVIGGTTAYTYNWNGGVTTANRTDLTAGTYNLTVTDANGCSTTTSATINQPSATLAVVASTNNVSCFGGNNGTINSTVTGGTTTYTYNWNGGITTANRTGLTADTYKLTVTDANGCSATTSATITQPAAALVVAASTNNVSCFGGNNGTINSTVTGGTTTYTYNWNGGITTANRTGLTAGTYNLTVTDANGCSATTSAIITQPSAALSVSASTNNASCFGGNNGTINTTVTGGTTAYSYNWSGGIITANRTGLTAGTYNLTVTDANGCSATTSATITQPSAALAVSASTNNASCFGGNNGTINTTVTGGTTAYSYNWSGGVTTANRTGLTAGTYNLIVTDANGCSATTSATITQPAAALAVAAIVTDAKCNSSNTGAITLTVSGGTTQYNYTWNDAVSSRNRTQINAGTYSVTVTDNLGCTESTTAVVNEPSELQVNLSSTNLLCRNSGDGTITTTVSGGTPAYNYNWGGGINTPNRTNLNAGNYRLTVTDNNHCAAIGSIQITQPTPIVISNTVANVSCFGGNNGNITVNPSGGTPGYNYSWSNGDSTGVVNNIVAGTYVVTVTDNNGCSAQKNISITEPVQLTIATTTVDVPCNGGSTGKIYTTVSGGTPNYLFAWSDGSNLRNRINIPVNTYQITVTDSKGCTVATSATINEPAALIATTTTINASCYGYANGQITTSVTGGTTPYTYNWGAGITTSYRDNLAAGNYRVTVKDGNNCVTTASASITQPAIISITKTVTAATCNGSNNGAINILASGGTAPYQYNWNNGDTSQNTYNLQAGNYTVTVNDNNQCTATASATINQPGQILLSETHTDINCFGGSNGAINLTASGGTAPYGYLWNTNATVQDINHLTSNTYTVNVTDKNNCSAQLSVVLNQPDSLKIIETHTNATCYNSYSGVVDVTGIGGVAPYTYLWNNVTSTNHIENVHAGNYTITVKDSNSCRSAIVVAITQPNNLALNKTITNVSCNGDDNGIITAIVSGGTAPYGYQWNNSQQQSVVGNLNPEQITDLEAGTYSVTVTDTNSCSISATYTVTQPVNALTISSNSIINASCNGSSNGSINTISTGGTTPYQYAWSHNNTLTSSRATSLPAGYYAVSVTDANGCSTVAAYTITEPAILQVTETHTNVTCNATATGAIQTITTGGTAPYRYRWNNNVSTDYLAGLTAGTYRLTVTDNNNCTDRITVAITQPAKLTLSATHTDALCYGSTDGTATVIATGGIAPYIYEWNTGETTAYLTHANAGTYSAVVKDVNDCPASITVNISQPTELHVNSTTNNVLCNGGNNGSAQLVVSGGTAPYGYSWNNTQHTQNISGVSAGTYTVTVNDAHNCVATHTDTITQPDAILINESHTAVSCNGGNNGTASVIVAGGTSPYHYNWSNLSHNATASNLQAGSYTITVIDNHQCTSSANVQVTQPTVLTTTETHTNVSCFGGNNGTANTVATGGTDPYGYLWSNNSATQNITSLSAATYTTTVTDANGCTTAASVIITEPAILAVTETHTDVTCHSGNNGTINAIVTGGTAPYGYLWSNGANTPSVNSNVFANNYTVTITDNNQCTASANAVVSQPTVITISPAHTDVLCFGGNNGTATAVVSGGTAPYGYRWSNVSTNTTATALTAGTYTLTVTDQNQCTAVSSVTVAQPPVLSASVNNTDLICVTGTKGGINLSVSGGTAPYGYTWNNGQHTQNITSLLPGQYLVTVTDNNGCTVRSTATVSAVSPFPVAVLPKNITCHGMANGTINTTVNGGTAPYTYQWNTGATQANLQSLNAGNYSITVVDNNQCTSTASAGVTEPPILSVNANSTGVVCYGGATGSVTLNANGGTAPYTFDWSDIAGTVDPMNRTGLRTGHYTVVVSDTFSCTASADANITEPAPLGAWLTKHNPTCYGDSTGSIISLVNGGTSPYTYEWNDHTTSANHYNLPAGIYVLSVTDSKNCTVAVNGLLRNPTQIVINETHSNVTCFGANNGQINIYTIGGQAPYNYSWNDQSYFPNRYNLSAGTYTLTAADALGCQTSAQVTITQPSQINITSEITNVRCFGDNNGAILLTVNGGNSPYNYSWNTNSTQGGISLLSPGNYSVTITDASGCANTNTFTITQPQQALSTSINQIHNTCFQQSNGSIDMNVDGGTAPYAYNWSNNSSQQDLTNISEGYYEVTITDYNGCTIENSAPIIEFPALQLNSNTDNPGCQNGYGNIEVNITSGVSPYTFHWNNGEAGSQLNHVHVGNYRLTVTDGNGCDYTSQYMVEVSDSLFTIDAGEDQEIQLGESAQLNATTNSTSTVSYQWQSPTTALSCTDCSNPMANPVRTITYYVTGTDNHGCTANDNVTVTVNVWGNVFVPNAFTPNGDGNNDYFEMFGSKEIWKEIQIMVFDRWGEKVFDSNDRDFKWDGIYKGKPAPPGVYVYVANVVHIDGRKEAGLKGSLTLIR